MHFLLTSSSQLRPFCFPFVGSGKGAISQISPVGSYFLIPKDFKEATTELV